jgi:ornithine cyclodeaminase
VISRLVSEGFDASIGDSGQLANADIVITATSSAQPLFAADDLKANAIIAAVGSHDPNSRELPGELMASGSVYVESRDSALREAGDVVMAISEGHLAKSSLIELKDLFGSSVDVNGDERRIYKSTGMSWQDLAIMAAVEKEL